MNYLDNHEGVITRLEPDILECEVKWTLGSITMNKASESDGIPAELLQTLKDDAVKVHSELVELGMKEGVLNGQVEDKTSRALGTADRGRRGKISKNPVCVGITPE